MDLILLANIIAGAGTLCGFIYGAVRFFREDSAIYGLMITMSSGVLVFGRLYHVIWIITFGGEMESFNLASLGIIGSLLFLFAANFGLMDAMGDDGSKEFRKYRLAALAAPIAVIALYLVFILLADTSVLEKSVSGAIAFFVLLASYFNLKHLIIPDIDFGVIRSMRRMNLFALIYEFLCIAETITLSRNLEIGTLIVCILTGLTMPLIIIFLDQGVRKWTA